MKLSSANIVSPVKCPHSKSYSARALILGSLKPSSVTIENLSDAQDTFDLIRCLSQCGLEINSGEIKNSFPMCEINTNKTIKLHVGEGGTTARFLLPFLALGKNRYECIFEGRLIDRPMLDLYQTLKKLGVFVEQTQTGVIIQGPLKNEQEIEIYSHKSSQFASAFKMLELAGVQKVKVQNLNHSHAYFQMTCEMVKHFNKSNHFNVPVDMSSLGYFICYAIHNQDLVISNVFNRDPLQADDAIFDILNDLNVEYTFSKNGLHIKKTNNFVKGIEIDASLCVDLVPTLFYLASYIPYRSNFHHCELLRDKESDRFEELKKILDNFQIKSKFSHNLNSFIIEGQLKRKYLRSNISTAPDHRMVMVASLFLKHCGGGEIYPSSSINKSFPDFFKYFS